MKFGVVVFPGTWSDQDCCYALRDVLGQKVEYLWHKITDVSSFDCIIIPGGFSYGDYLRAGAVATFSPIMKAIRVFSDKGGLVVGICNGFQILCEAGMLPGVLMRNIHLEYRCQWTDIVVENSKTSFTSGCSDGQILRVPISHGEGNYYADQTTLDQLETNGQILFRYCGPKGQIADSFNPNGSARSIAGIINQSGNVLGMMPHPERCCEPLIGGSDGRFIFQSLIGNSSI